MLPDYSALPPNSDAAEVSGDVAAGKDEVVTTGLMHLGEAHLQYLALGRVRGQSAYVVGRQVGLSPSVVERVWRGELRPDELAKYEAYVAELSTEEATAATYHRTRMMDMRETAYLRIDKTIQQDEDLKLAADTAWRVIEEGGVQVRTSREALLGATIEGGGTVNVSNTQVVVNEASAKALGGAVENVLAEVEKMGPVRHILEGNRHTRVNEREVIDVPVPVEPGEEELE